MTENTHHRDEDQGPAGGRPPAPEDFSLPTDLSDGDLFDEDFVAEDSAAEGSGSGGPGPEYTGSKDSVPQGSAADQFPRPAPVPAAGTATEGAAPTEQSGETGVPEAAEPAAPAQEDLDEPGDVVVDGEPQEIVAPTDIGTNAQQVVTALLGHQRDLVAELRSVYDRLEEVREVDYAALQERMSAAESTVAAAPTTAELEQLVNLLEEISGSLKDQETKQAVLQTQLKETSEQHAAQLAERDARISAQNARIEELESAITATAESADAAHERLEALAKETGSSVIHRVQDRVSPAAHQAKNALNNIRRRFKR